MAVIVVVEFPWDSTLERFQFFTVPDEPSTVEGDEQRAGDDGVDVFIAANTRPLMAKPD